MSNPSLLSASIPALLIISSLIFLLISGLQLLNIRSKRKLPLITKFIGFLFLAISTVSPIVNSINDLTSAIFMIISAILIALSYIIPRFQTTFTEVPPPLSSKTPTTKNVIVPKNIKDTSEKKPPTSSPVKPDYNKPNQAQQPVQAKVTPAQITRSAIKKETGLKTTPLIKLPAQRRKKARTLVNTLVGFLVFFLVGWGSYAIAKRIIKPQPTPGADTPGINKQTGSPLPLNNIQLAPQDSAPAKKIIPSEESAKETAEKNEEPKPSPTNMLTIKDTETGFLNVREGASTATSIITKIDPGDKYEFLSENKTGDWYKIQIDDNTAGWISAKYADKN